MTTSSALPRLRVLTLDQASDYHRVLYNQLGGLIDESGLDNTLDWARLRNRLARMDVFHLHWPEWLLDQDLALHRRFAAMLRQAGVSLVWSQHNLSAHESPARWHPIYRFWAHQADGVIHHSNWGMHEARARLPFGRHTVHVVMPHPHFGLLRTVDRGSRREIERHLGWRHDVLRLTIIGAPRPGKLVTDVAAAISRSWRDDVELRVFSLRFGEPIVADPRIFAEPYVRADRLLWDQRLAVSDALVLPFHETSMLTTGTVADAVAHALPCLTSDWSYLTETLKDAAIVYGSSPSLLTNLLNGLDQATLVQARDAAADLQAQHSPQVAASILYELLLTVRHHAGESTSPRSGVASTHSPRGNRP